MVRHESTTESLRSIAWSRSRSRAARSRASVTRTRSPSVRSGSALDTRLGSSRSPARVEVFRPHPEHLGTFHQQRHRQQRPVRRSRGCCGRYNLESVACVPRVGRIDAMIARGEQYSAPHIDCMRHLRRGLQAFGPVGQKHRSEPPYQRDGGLSVPADAAVRTDVVVRHHCCVPSMRSGAARAKRRRRALFAQRRCSCGRAKGDALRRLVLKPDTVLPWPYGQASGTGRSGSIAMAFGAAVPVV